LTENKKSKINESVVIGGMSKLAAASEKKLKSGFVGSALGTHSNDKKLVSNCFVASVLGRRSKLGGWLNKVRFFVSEQFEDSMLLNLFKRFMAFFIGCRMRFYGAFFASFSIFSALIYFFDLIFIPSNAPSVSTVIFSFVLLLASLPMLLSGKTLSSRLTESRAGHFIVYDVLGISNEKMNIAPSKYGDAYNIAVFSGIAAGVLSYFIEPWKILGAILSFFVFSIIIAFPETGVIFVLALFPLLSSASAQFYLYALILFYCIGYVIKLIRGKRVLGFDLVDLSMLLFGIVIITLGAFGINPNSVSESLKILGLLIGAFFAGKLMRTRAWMSRCIAAVIVSGTISAMITVIGYSSSRAGFLILSDFVQRNSFFDSSRILVGYFIIAFALSLSCALNNKTKLSAASAVASVIILIAMMSMSSASGFLGLLVMILTFFIIRSPKNIPSIIILALVSCCVIMYTNGSWIQGIKESFDVSSTGAYSLLQNWAGAMDLSLASALIGIGFGGFSEFYPLYAVSGFESRETAGALWLRLLSELGIVGLAAFAFVVFACLRCGFRHLLFENKSRRGFIAALFAAFIGMLVQSLFCDIISDHSFFYIFLCLMTIMCAGVKNEIKEKEKQSTLKINTDVSASIDL